MLFLLEMSSNLMKTLHVFVAQLLLYLPSSGLCSFLLISSHHVDVRLTQQLIVWNWWQTWPPHLLAKGRLADVLKLKCTLNIHAFTVPPSWSFVAWTDSQCSLVPDASGCCCCSAQKYLLSKSASILNNMLYQAMPNQPDAMMNLLPLLPPHLLREWIRVHTRLAVQVVTATLLLLLRWKYDSEMTWVLWLSYFLQVCRFNWTIPA